MDDKVEVYAYSAGLMDGEGTISLTVNSACRDFRYPAVTVASTDIELLEFLKKEFGGNISSKKKYKKHHRQSYNWSLRYNSAISFLQKIYPFLKIEEKRKRAHLILTRYKKVTPRNGQYTSKMYLAKKAFEKEFFSIKGLHSPKVVEVRGH